MTVSTTSDYNPARDEILRLAFLKAGLIHGQQQLSADQVSVGAGFLRLFLEELQTAGVVLNALERSTLPLVAGAASLSAPADTLTIEKLATIRSTNALDYTIECAGNVETYQTIPDKSVVGRPSLFYVEKTPANTWTIYLWPVPSADYSTITFLRTRKLRDIDTGAVNLDLPPKFAPVAVTKVAAELAAHYKRADNTIIRLAAEGRDKLDRVLDTETVSGNCIFLAPTLIAGDN